MGAALRAPFLHGAATTAGGPQELRDLQLGSDQDFLLTISTDDEPWELMAGGHEPAAGRPRS